jgi:polar amino acid transport system substrate-binding protein
MKILPAALAVGMLGLAACSSQTKDTTTSATGGAVGLKAVVINDALPYSNKNGDAWTGLAVEVLKAIQKEQSEENATTELSYVEVGSVSEAKDALTSGTANIVCGVGFSWKRSRQINYTIPFAVGGMRLLTTEGVDGTPESMKGKQIGVITGSIPANLVESQLPEADTKGFDSPDAALKALKGGEIATIAGGALWSKANMAEVPGSSMVPDRPYGRAGVGCAVTHGNDALLASGNLAIGQLLQGYVDGDEESTRIINSSIGPDSPVGLEADKIAAYYNSVLGTVAGIGKDE